MQEIRVSQKIKIAGQIYYFELTDPNGGILPAFSPGSHIDVDTGEGVIRQYSLCNDPAEQHRYCIAVLLSEVSRGGSKRMHENIHIGDILQINVPRNMFNFSPDSDHTILFAAGIGITPILSMAWALYNSGNKFSLHYCGRKSENMAFMSTIHNLPFFDNITLHITEGDINKRINLRNILTPSMPENRIFMCGPESFMNDISQMAKLSGWQEEKIHREDFAPVDHNHISSNSFTLYLARSGLTIEVNENESALEALLREGIDMNFSCEQGICGSCLTTIIEGEAIHNDAYLTAKEKSENKSFLPCCSRAKSLKLILDL